VYIHYKVHIHEKMTDKADTKNDIKETAEEIREVEDFVNVEETSEKKPVPLTKNQVNGAKLVQCMQTIVAMKKKKQEILSKRKKESDAALNKRGVKTDIKPCQLRKSAARVCHEAAVCLRTSVNNVGSLKRPLSSTSSFPAYKTMAEIKVDEEKKVAAEKVIADKKEQEFRNKVEARQHRIISALYQCNKPSLSAAALADEIKINMVKSMVLLDEDLQSTQTGTSNTLDLMIFEDDTFKLVPHIPEKNMDIILSFYEQSDNIVDAEATAVSFPEGKIDDLLFNSVNVSHKDEFVASFLPQYIIHKQMENNLDAFQSRFNLKKSGALNSYDGPGFGGGSKSGSVMSGIVLPASLKKSFVSPKKNDFASQDYVSEAGKTYMGNQWGFNASSKAMPIIKDGKPNNNDEENFEPATTKNEIEGFSFGAFSHHGWFNSDMESIGQIEQEKHPKDASKNMVVLLNRENAKIIHTIVLTDPSAAILETIEKYSEYGWTQLFSVQSKLPVISEFIRKEFDAAKFYNTDALNAMLESTASFVKSSRVTAKDEFVVQSEESAVTEFLKDKYTIDDNVEHKLKASALCDVIIQNEIVNISDNQLTSFKNRLARYLKTLGLRKKRYNDGFYYYGIQKKEVPFPIPLLSAGVGTRQMFESLDKDKTHLSDYTYQYDIRGGVDTSGISQKNANWSIRSEPLNPQVNTGIWNHSTISNNTIPVSEDNKWKWKSKAPREISGTEMSSADSATVLGSPPFSNGETIQIRSDKPSANATIGAWNTSTVAPDLMYNP